MSFRDNLSDALRIARWRRPRAETSGIAPLTVFGLFAGAALVVTLWQYILAGASFHTFNPYGINSIIAIAAVQALVIVAFARIDPTSRTIRNLVLLHLVALPIGLVARAISQAFGLDDPEAYSSPFAAIGACALMIVSIVWIAGGARQAFRGVPGVRRPALRGFAFTIVSVISTLALPNWPVVASAHFERATANLWEMAYQYRYASPAAQREAENQASEARAAEIRAARLEARQTALLDAAVGSLEPRDPNAGNVFAIGVAGWGGQDVFMLETQQSLDILTSRFHLGKRVLSLVNNPATADERPMASMQNIASALRAVGARMDPEKDVLILSMTSHGSPDGFALRYGDFVERTLDPQTLKTLLDDAGIKNRILIVSSCYSGAFVAPLADANTAILTAASSTHTSFGCANDRKWTYFGEAFFEKGLVGAATIADAFEAARATIAAWESEQKLVPSDPQIAIGDEIARRFPELVGAAGPAPAVAAEAGRAHASRD
jgi:hypothetical protein